MYESLLSILHKEVKPALGCTGPTSVSYAASVAKEVIGGKVKSVKVFVDRDTYKNSIAVGIPGTSEMGVVIAAALGALCGDSSLGLEVLKNVTKEDENKAIILAENNVSLEINWNIDVVGLYIDVWVETDLGTGHAIVAKTHTNVILIETNNKIIYKDKDDEIKNILDETKDIIASYNVKEFYEFATKVPIEELSFLRESIKMNKELAETGLRKKSGKGFGDAFIKLQKTESTFIKAKAYTAAASDARMVGENLPAMSCASSGNVGITASLPLYVMALENGINEDLLLRALGLSFLMTIYIKNHIGRLSAMCACAIAASIGVGAGTVILFEGSLNEVEGAIKNIIGSIGGVLCDGAKLGCALKLSSAVGVAIESAFMAMDNSVIPSGDGIVCETADETIKMLGRIARLGMVETDKVICKEIILREKNNKRYN
jgi:L-cysteine desulfidase